MGLELSNSEERNDVTLVAEARAGKREAFSELVRRHQTAIYRVCYRVLGNPEDAEDAAQEAFLRAYDRLATFESRSTFKTWMTRLAVNVSLNARVRRKSSSPLLDVLRSNEPDPEAQSIRSESVHELREALRLLPDGQRIAIVLHDLEGMPYKEIAEVLDVPPGTAKVWAFRGRERLRDLLT